MRPTRIHISVFVLLGAAIWAATLAVQGVPVTPDHFAPFGTVVGAIGIVLLLLDRVLWRQAFLHGWFVNRPDLRGTWEVRIDSDWEADGGDSGPAQLTGYMGVEQTLFTLQMHMMTAESESWLIASSIGSSPSQKGYRIAAVYTNQPSVFLRASRSAIHFGAWILDTHGETPRRPDSVSGEYWTDRKTVGRIELTARIADLHSSFTDAQAAFGRGAQVSSQDG